MGQKKSRKPNFHFSKKKIQKS